MGKVITIKNNKGGVGKTFITTQLAAGLAYGDKKVLILTSDPQNNVFNFLFKGDKTFKKGLKAEVLKKDGEYFRLRSNLYFLPLEDVKFSNLFLKEIVSFIERVKNEFDYILVDSIPTLKIDEIFLKLSDDIIIPSYADELTTESILELLKTIDVSKVKAIVTNRYKSSSSVHKTNYTELKNDLDGTPILFTDPIESLTFIELMIQNRKTIWEYNNVAAKKVQNIFLEILKVI
ncbi:MULTISPECIES: ParA family protein [Cetobacterium]|jgi:chromosome partitioning protein|uniref:AAA family ATPase n=1 Tax=Candidatus Cetobacterium colombiensis TaxID=3073100 RepID=A0ABU4WD17_9FUSO|nr:AAA family ATPase [Candidatus Cetobacterium colombiensis]MDX8337422.1 AAA family ATPase [Candidatus Cetobacterium colombiensis]